MTRWIYGWILSTIGFLVVLVPACNQFSQVAEKTRDAANKLVEKGKEAGLFVPANQKVAARTTILQRGPTEIAIGTMNIQTFGPKKIANTKVMGTLVNIARQFDVFAIQEVRSKHDQTILQQYINMINSDGSQYSYVLSPLLGSERYSEQYAFVYDTTRIELVDEGAVIPDPQQLLHREPMFSRFRTRTSNINQSFSFALANVHIDPDLTRSELTTLYYAYEWLRSYLVNYEDDVILLGDFNEPPRNYGQLWQIQTLAAALPDNVTTNTRQKNAYDNILIDRATTQEFTGKAGVIDIQREFGLTMQEARDVSDHLPVWAIFSAGEYYPRQQFARQPTGSQGM